jgi:hypothetical protein
MVNLNGLVLIVPFVLVLVITLGWVMLLTPMIFILGLNAPTEVPVIVRLVFVPAFLDMMGLPVNVLLAPIIVMIEVHVGLRSIWL